MNDHPRSRASRRLDPALAAIVLGAALLFAWLTRDIRQWGAMTDELLYKELAEGFASGGLPRVHGELVPVYNLLYPLVIAPVVGLFEMGDAYGLIVKLNGLLMASAAIPAYLLSSYLRPGRRDVALGVAACTAFVPWLALGTMAWTIALAYPVFLWTMVAGTRALAEPSRRADAIALAALVVAFATRVQFLYLLAVFGVAAGVLCAVTARGRPAPALRRLWESHPFTTSAAVAIGCLLFVKSSVVLGNYGVTLSRSRDPSSPVELLNEWVSQIDLIAIGIGAVPLVLAVPWLAGAIARPDDERSRPAAVFLALVVVANTAVSAAFVERFVTGAPATERYAFYVAPLLILCAALFVTSRPRAFAWTAVPAGVAVVMLLGSSYGSPVPWHAPVTLHYEAPASLFADTRQRIADATGLPLTLLVVLLSAGVLVAIVLAAQRRDAGRGTVRLLLGGLAAFLALQAVDVVDTAARMQNLKESALLGQGARRVLDSVAGGDSVALVRTPLSGSRYDELWWDAEFWSGAVSDLLVYRAEGPALRPTHALHIDFASGRMSVAGGRSVPSRIVTAERNVMFAPVGPPTPEPAGPGLELWQVAAPPRVRWVLAGTDPDGAFRDGGRPFVRLFGTRGRPRFGLGIAATGAKSYTYVCPGPGEHTDVPVPRRAGVKGKRFVLGVFAHPASGGARCR